MMTIRDCPELEVVRTQAADISARSEEIEAARCVPADIIERLHREGLFAMTMLKEHGGSERDIRDSMAVIEALSHADASVGWCAMIYLTTATACATLSPEWARTIVALGKPCAITAGAAQPRGRGKWVEGGMEVTGHWSWGSGIHHCDLICGGTVVEDDQAGSKTYIVYFEPHQVKLYDNWNPSGLKGTGSVDFSVDRAFVPEGRWTILGGSPRRSSGVLSRLPYFGMFASCVACVPLGIARCAIDDFCELARAKVSTGGSQPIAKSSLVQLDLGRAEALVASARQHLFGTMGEVWEKLSADEKLTIEDVRSLRLAASQSAASCASAVDLVYHAAGGSAPLPEYALQRHFRDVHTATQHAMVDRKFLGLSGAARLLDLKISDAGL